MNKHGADKLISVYWFAILFIVAAAIVYMVFIFYGEPYDVRELEANTLTNQVAGCLSEAGYLKPNLFNNEEFKENFLETCDINLDVEDVYGWKEQGQYYLEINFYDFGTYPNSQSLFEISEGNLNLKSDCDIDNKNFPFCLEREFYVIDGEDNRYVVSILSIVRKTEKNVQ